MCWLPTGRQSHWHTLLSSPLLSQDSPRTGQPRSRISFSSATKTFSKTRTWAEVSRGLIRSSKYLAAAHLVLKLSSKEGSDLSQDNIHHTILPPRLSCPVLTFPPGSSQRLAGGECENVRLSVVQQSSLVQCTQGILPAQGRRQLTTFCYYSLIN